MARKVVDPSLLLEPDDSNDFRLFPREHDGHDIQLVYSGVVGYHPAEIDDDGDVKLTGPFHIDDISESEVWCGTCSTHVFPSEESGLSEDWSSY